MNYVWTVRNVALETKWVKIRPLDTYPLLTHPKIYKVNEFGGPKLNTSKMLAVGLI